MGAGRLVAATRRRRGRRLKLEDAAPAFLLVGITAMTDRNVLERWAGNVSNRAVRSLALATGRRYPLTMTVTAAVTMTRTLNEGDTAAVIASLQALDSLGLPVFVSDGGSLPAFQDSLARLAHFRRQADSRGLVQQMRTGFRAAAAAGHRYVFYSEPDKREFFARGARPFLSAAAVEDAAVFIAARDEASFSTFPTGQQATERAFNQIANVYLRPLTDLLYGPLVLDLEAALPWFDMLPDELVWGWRIYAIARAAADSRVGSFVGSFPCPQEQRHEDDLASRLYRLEQARQCLHGLRLGIRDSGDRGWQAPNPPLPSG